MQSRLLPLIADIPCAGSSEVMDFVADTVLLHALTLEESPEHMQIEEEGSKLSFYLICKLVVPLSCPF